MFLRVFAFLKHFKFRSKNPLESQKMRFRAIFRRMIVNRKIKQKFCRVRDGNTEQKINIEREKPDCFQLSIKYGLHRDDFYQLTVIIRLLDDAFEI